MDLLLNKCTIASKTEAHIVSFKQLSKGEDLTMWVRVRRLMGGPSLSKGQRDESLGSWAAARWGWWWNMFDLGSA